MDCIKMVVTMNPCRCGYYPDISRCHCTPLQIRRYLGRISQPLLDRIDLTIEVRPVNIDALQQEADKEESSKDILCRVEQARQMQAVRFEKTDYLYNSQLTDRDVESYCCLGSDESAFMKKIYEQFELSARSYHKILKVARTIADLAGRENISKEDLSEAVFYKTIDRSYWGGIYGKK